MSYPLILDSDLQKWNFELRNLFGKNTGLLNYEPLDCGIHLDDKEQFQQLRNDVINNHYESSNDVVVLCVKFVGSPKFKPMPKPFFCYYNRETREELARIEDTDEATPIKRPEPKKSQSKKMKEGPQFDPVTETEPQGLMRYIPIEDRPEFQNMITVIYDPTPNLHPDAIIDRSNMVYWKLAIFQYAKTICNGLAYPKCWFTEEGKMKMKTTVHINSSPISPTRENLTITVRNITPNTSKTDIELIGKELPIRGQDLHGQYIMGKITKNDFASVYMCRIGETPVGLAVGNFHRVQGGSSVNPEVVHTDKQLLYYYLHAISTLTAYNGKGLGGRFMENIEYHAFEKKKCHTMILESMIDAYYFYKRIGFVIAFDYFRDKDAEFMEKSYPTLGAGNEFTEAFVENTYKRRRELEKMQTKDLTSDEKYDRFKELEDTIILVPMLKTREEYLKRVNPETPVPVPVPVEPTVQDEPDIEE